MPIRVIAGIAKGRKLNLVPGDSTRPVMDKVKQALFNILGRDVIDSNFLDLFAGTGSVGIEALSRGAERAVFIEMDGMAVKTIQENLKLTKFGDKAVIRRTDVFSFLKQPPAEPFDFIYVAPPQYKDMWLKALHALDDNPTWVPPGTIVVVQLDPTERQEVALKHLEAYDERRYGKTIIWFFEARTPESTDAEDTPNG
ncbi:MAG: 16S rRNA (guanine(966)-N(2))-methyltransferase RsmD [Burkholderiales bacterium]|nr:16S rRNA (guanine(966)-N(2))-methyltransferase RsmD [Anaerolineae bacterium]